MGPNSAPKIRETPSGGSMQGQKTTRKERGRAKIQTKPCRRPYKPLGLSELAEPSKEPNARPTKRMGKNKCPLKLPEKAKAKARPMMRSPAPIPPNGLR